MRLSLGNCGLWIARAKAMIASNLKGSCSNVCKYIARKSIPRVAYRVAEGKKIVASDGDDISFPAKTFRIS